MYLPRTSDTVDGPDGVAALASGGGSNTTTSSRVSCSPPSESNSTFRNICFPVAPRATPPADLPDPTQLLAFDISLKKREIFQQARLTISQKAQYTKSRRKPWTQITAFLPLDNTTTTYEEDLSVVWELMKGSNISQQSHKVNAAGDNTWHMYGHEFLAWLDIDYKTTKPEDKYVHPVNFDTGALERKRLQIRLAKEGPSEALTRQFENLEEKENAAAADDGKYHWANYEQCLVTFKKKQPRKAKHGEVQINVKIRTYEMGVGDPRNHGGYMLFSSVGLEDMDPSTDFYARMSNRML